MKISFQLKQIDERTKYKITNTTGDFNWKIKHQAQKQTDISVITMYNNSEEYFSEGKS